MPWIEEESQQVRVVVVYTITTIDLGVELLVSANLYKIVLNFDRFLEFRKIVNLKCRLYPAPHLVHIPAADIPAAELSTVMGSAGFAWPGYSIMIDELVRHYDIFQEGYL